MDSSNWILFLVVLGLISLFLARGKWEKKADQENDFPSEPNEGEEEIPSLPSDVGPWLKIQEAHSNTEADIIRDYFNEHHIPVFIKGYSHRSMLGLVGSFISLDVMVPEKFAGEAGAILKQIEEHEAEFEQLDSEKSEVVKAVPLSTSSTLRPRNKMVAFVLPLFLAGLGNLYARNSSSGFVILALGLICSLGIFLIPPDTGHWETLFLYGVTGYILLVVIDIITSIRFISRNQANAGPQGLEQ